MQNVRVRPPDHHDQGRRSVIASGRSRSSVSNWPVGSNWRFMIICRWFIITANWVAIWQASQSDCGGGGTTAKARAKDSVSITRKWAFSDVIACGLWACDELKESVGGWREWWQEQRSNVCVDVLFFVFIYDRMNDIIAPSYCFW